MLEIELRRMPGARQRADVHQPSNAESPKDLQRFFPATVGKSNCENIDCSPHKAIIPPMQHAGMTLEDIRLMLYERAEKRFGKQRADELRADIEQTAAELLKVVHHPVGFEDE